MKQVRRTYFKIRKYWFELPSISYQEKGLQQTGQLKFPSAKQWLPPAIWELWQRWVKSFAILDFLRSSSRFWRILQKKMNWIFDWYHDLWIIRTTSTIGLENLFLNGKRRKRFSNTNFCSPTLKKVILDLWRHSWYFPIYKKNHHSNWTYWSSYIESNLK